MLVEVAESSLERDRRKRHVYARAGIASYWIVIITDRQVDVYIDPSSQGQDPDYRQASSYRSGQTVPLRLDGNVIADIPVSDLLP